MANNFMRQLLGGIQSSYGQAEGAVYDRLADERKFAQQEAMAEKEREREDWELKNDTNIIGSLISGKIQQVTPEGENFERDMTESEKQQAALRLSSKGLRRFGDISKAFSPEDPGKVQYRTLGNSIYKIDPETGFDPDPVATAKARPIGTHWGKQEETGQYGFFSIYDDGSFKFEDPGMAEPVKGSSASSKKESSGPQSFDDFDNNKFTTWLNQKVDQLNAIESLKTQYRDIRGLDRNRSKESKMKQINNLAEDGASALYTLMPPDTKAIVDDIEMGIEQKAKKYKLDAKGFMDKYVTSKNGESYYFRDKIKDNLQKQIGDLWDKGEIGNKEAKVLQQWIKFKFGYIIEGE